MTIDLFFHVILLPLNCKCFLKNKNVALIVRLNKLPRTSHVKKWGKEQKIKPSLWIGVMHRLLEGELDARLFQWVSTIHRCLGRRTRSQQANPYLQVGTMCGLLGGEPDARPFWHTGLETRKRATVSHFVVRDWLIQRYTGCDDSYWSKTQLMPAVFSVSLILQA